VQVNSLDTCCEQVEDVRTTKITTDPHILANVLTGFPDDRYPKLKIYISEVILDRYEYIPVAYVTMHYMF
jgi:hypothetical protein